MKVNDFDGKLAEFISKYPSLFNELRKVGWHEGRRADPVEVAQEPHWRMAFPMHDLAREFLLRFHGIELVAMDWNGVRFGCKQVSSADTLKATAPYDAEEFILEEDVDMERPPAFPIGTMNDWMLFLREDWTTITISYRWRDVLLSNDPFEIIDEFRRHARRIWDDPKRHIEITDFRQVPISLIGGAFDS